MDGREHQGFILVSSIGPLIAFFVAVVLLWNDAVTTPDLVAFAVMFVISGLGVSTGYHRLLTHRSFETYRPLRFAFAAAGAMAGQGPPIIWSAHHRRHHRLADKPGDPHSPYDDEERGIRGALKGLWHAHLGWLFNPSLSSDPIRYCPDLARDKDLRFISNHFLWFVAAGIALPAAIGLGMTGTLAGAATAALWGGPVRFFFANHLTYSINSVGHYFGSRRFPTPDESRNVAFLGLLSFGEAWHNNHHAFPRAASHGMRWYEVDISGLVIRALEKLRLAWNVVSVSRESQDRRAAGPAVRAGRRAPSLPPKPLAERSKDALVSVADVE
jgi:stearoyl-CoA desaturase (delta-9 desaturase)